MLFNKQLATCIFMVMSLSASYSLASKPENQGREIMEQFTSRENGFGDFQAEVTMLIRKKNGKQFDRHMAVRSLENKDYGEKRLFVFDRPRTIRGTAILSHTLKDHDLQWIYLPAFKRIKRIASSNQSGPFVSSEFSYEDLTSIELDKYRYQYIKDDTVNEKPCYVVKMTPLFENSGYQHQLAYIDKTDYILHQIDYYDVKGSLLKTLTLTDYKKYIDRFWRALTMTMINHQNGRSTTMTWTDITYGNSFSENDFSTNALKRSR